MSEDANNGSMPAWGTHAWRMFLLIAICKKSAHRTQADWRAIEIAEKLGFGEYRNLVDEWDLK
jgi:hypothetical protein